MGRKLLLGAAIAGVVCVLLPAREILAHHSFAAEFDANKPVTLRGVVSKVEWINPHAWIHIDVTSPDGTTQRWMIEAGSPITLLRRGISKDSLVLGTVIVVGGYQSRDGLCKPKCRANGRDMTFPDGRKLFVSPSSTNIPER